ncbi:MAG: hypothetical protein ACJ790_12950 [Myxococcaceae bacterium]
MKSLRLSAACVALAIVAASCRCNDGSLGGVDLGFKVSGETVDFGRALEGSVVERNVELVSQSRANVTVELSTEGPFSTGATITIPAGTSVKVPVDFHAGSTKEQGKLLLGPGDKRISVPLVGEGVHPLDCVASAVCHVSVFDLATNSCIETASNEGDSCISTNPCLENGSCRSGVCVGTPRSCDDGNKCTVDGCSEDTGCVNAPIACPTPSNPCHAAICDPLSGCGEAFVGDGTTCGAVDCINAQLCFSGTCVSVDTPEDFVCAPPTPCQGEGHCLNKQCVRPDAGTMTPAFSALLQGEVLTDDAGAPNVLAFNGNLYFELCNQSDGGCSLTSYTPTGFLRFSTRHQDAREHRLIAISDAGVITSSGESVETFASNNGALLVTHSLSEDGGAHAGPGEFAVLSDSGVIVAVAQDDAGELIQLAGDGGVEIRDALPAVVQVAVDEDGQLFALDVNGVVHASDADFMLDAGATAFVVSNGALLVGGRGVLHLDGGVSYLDWNSSPQPRTPIETELYAAENLGYAFATACQPPATNVCSADELFTEVRVLKLADATTSWSQTIVSPFQNGRLKEVAVLDWPGGGVATLADYSLDGGSQSVVQAYGSAQKLFVCPLPEGAQTQGAVFDRSFLFAIMKRNGQTRLEAYDLKGLKFETSGWPQRAGISGTRRAR